MSDPKPPAVPPTTAAKAAEPVAAHEGDGAKLQAKQMTLGDHLFIWTMVLLVGVIFGIGPSIGLVLKRETRVGDFGVDQGLIDRRQRVATILTQVLGYSAGEDFTERSPAYYALNQRKAQLADARGLMPVGPAAQTLLDDFLARPAGDRSIGARLRDNRQSNNLELGDLSAFLAERFAVAALDARSQIAPITPRAAVAPAWSMARDQVPVDEVIISVAPLLADVPANDPELTTVYEQLVSQGRFLRPEARQLTVYAADPSAHIDTVPAPTDEAIAAYYAANQPEFTVPAEVAPTPVTDPPTAPVATTPTVKPLADVREQIVATLRRQAASAEADRRLAAFQDAAERGALEQAPAEKLRAAAEQAGLTVHSGIEVPDAGTADVVLGALGTIPGKTARDVGLAAAKPGEYLNDGYITDRGVRVSLRLDGRRAAERTPLDDPTVSAAVRATLAGRRAYITLMKEAEALRAQAEAAGPGGLRRVFADPAQAKWAATVQRTQMAVGSQLAAPEPVEGGTSGEARLAVSLAVAKLPVALVAQAPQGDLPRVRLVQAAGYTAGSAPDVAQLPYFTEAVRNFAAQAQSKAAQDELIASVGR